MCEYCKRAGGNVTKSVSLKLSYTTYSYKALGRFNMKAFYIIDASFYQCFPFLMYQQ